MNFNLPWCLKDNRYAYEWNDVYTVIGEINAKVLLML